MRNLFFAAVVLFATLTAEARPPKVLERSEKKAPSWVKKVDKDHITVILETQSLEEGQEKAMEQVRNDIISGVAVNVSASSSLDENEMIINENSELISNYESKIETVAAKLPYVTGINASKAEVYWVKYMDRDTENEYYYYALRYPFSQFDRSKLITDFEIRDAKYYERFKKLRGRIDEIDTVEDIDKLILDLKPYKDYFFDVSRLSEVKALETSCRSLYRDITIVPGESGDGYFTYSIVLDGKNITTTRKAKVKSETLSELSVTKIDNGQSYRLNYNSEYYLQGAENKIQLVYGLPSYSLTYTFYKK